MKYILLTELGSVHSTQRNAKKPGGYRLFWASPSSPKRTSKRRPPFREGGGRLADGLVDPQGPPLNPGLRVPGGHIFCAGDMIPHGPS